MLFNKTKEGPEPCVWNSQRKCLTCLQFCPWIGIYCSKQMSSFFLFASPALSHADWLTDRQTDSQQVIWIFFEFFLAVLELEIRILLFLFNFKNWNGYCHCLMNKHLWSSKCYVMLNNFIQICCYCCCFCYCCTLQSKSLRIFKCLSVRLWTRSSTFVFVCVH